MSSSATRRLSRRSRGDDNSVEQLFHENRHLYNNLAVRAIEEGRIFLPRNLRRPPNARRRVPLRPPSVLYTSAETDVDWRKEVHHLRCLWCKGTFFKFVNARELMTHLTNCHDRFSYSMSEGKERVTIHMHLNSAHESWTSVEILQAYEMEHVYINLSRFAPKSLPRRVAKETTESARADGKRPTRACAQRQKPEEPKRQVRLSPSPVVKKRKEPSKKKSRPRVKLPYASVQEAIRKKRLYHSVVQNPMEMKELGVDEDSDFDTKDEEEWRLTLLDEEVLDYSDTLAVEKLFMNLWNQFLRLEYKVYADVRVRPACMEFVTKYRVILQELNMEVVFLRHLNSFLELGLVDADTIFEAFRILRDRNPKPKTEEEKNAKHVFMERIIKDAKENEAKEKAAKEEAAKEEAAKEEGTKVQESDLREVTDDEIEAL